MSSPTARTEQWREGFVGLEHDGAWVAGFFGAREMFRESNPKTAFDRFFYELGITREERESPEVRWKEEHRLGKFVGWLIEINTLLLDRAAARKTASAEKCAGCDGKGSFTLFTSGPQTCDRCGGLGTHI